MKRVMTAAALVVCIMFTVAFAGGCLGQRIAERVTEEIVEKAIEGGSGEDIEIDSDKGEVTIRDEEGETTISGDDENVTIKSGDDEAVFGEDTELPEDFPESVPLYDDINLTSYWKTSEDDSTTFSITAVSEDSVDDIFGWYKDQLSGWEISGEFTMETDEGKNSSFTAESGGMEIVLMVMNADEGTTMVLTVTER